MAFNNNYDTDGFNASTIDDQIVAIHICGYVNKENEGDEDGNSPTNHWAAFLVHGQHQSTLLDMAPGYGPDGLRGKIELSSKGYASTQNAIKVLRYPVNMNATVSSLVTLINSKGRDKYDYSPEWEGCRYWIYIFISDLEDSKIVPPGSAQQTWNAVTYYWRYPSGQDFREVKQGSFR